MGGEARTRRRTSRGRRHVSFREAEVEVDVRRCIERRGDRKLEWIRLTTKRNRESERRRKRERSWEIEKGIEIGLELEIERAKEMERR
jgi:hypothetical protein